MRYVNLEGYEPGPKSPRKPADMSFPGFPDAVYPAVHTHPVSGRKTLGTVEQFLTVLQIVVKLGFLMTKR